MHSVMYLQVICYEGCARMTVLAGNVSVNGYVISSEQTSKCSLHSPSGFPCHAIHSAEQPHIFANSAPPPQTDFQELVDTISGRSGLAAENQQQVRLFLQEIVQSEDSVTSVIQLEEKVDGVNRLLSGSCGLGHFYSVCSCNKKLNASGHSFVCVLASAQIAFLHPCAVISSRHCAEEFHATSFASALSWLLCRSIIQ